MDMGGGANNGGTHEGDQGPEFYDASDWNVSRGGSPRTFAFGSFLSEDGQEDEEEPFFDMHDGAGGEEGLGGFDGLASPQQQGGGVGGFEVRAVADYASDDVTELCFATGDIIEVLNVRSSGWWKGRLLTIGGEWPSPTSFPYPSPTSFPYPSSTPFPYPSSTSFPYPSPTPFPYPFPTSFP